MHKHPLTFHMVSRNNLVDKHYMLKKNVPISCTNSPRLYTLQAPAKPRHVRPRSKRGCHDPWFDWTARLTVNALVVTKLHNNGDSSMKLLFWVVNNDVVNKCTPFWRKHAANHGSQGQLYEINATLTAKCANMQRIMVPRDVWQAWRENEHVWTGFTANHVWTAEWITLSVYHVKRFQDIKNNNEFWRCDA